MTDSTDDHEENRSDEPPGRTISSDVPNDADWQLEIQVPFDEGGRHDLTSSIIVAIAEVEDVRASEIKTPPLYEVVDVPALEAALFGSSTVGQSSTGLRSVEFMYRGHRIVIRSDAWIQVYSAVEP